MNKSYLIILSGWAVKSFVWNKFIKFLSQEYKVLYIDWYDVVSLEDFKKKVISVINKNKIKEFSLLGWSLGSLVALDLALDNSFTINKLILIGGTSKFISLKDRDYPYGYNKRIVEKMKVSLLRNMDSTLEAFYKNLFSDDEKKKGYLNKFLTFEKENIITDGFGDIKVSLALGLEYLIQKDLRNKLSEIEIPILMIHGSKDFICPLENAVFIKNHTINSKIIIIENLGHVPFFTDAYRCYKAVKYSYNEHLGKV